MIVGSRRKQRGEAPPTRACSQKNCGRQRLSVSLADGERNTKGRTVRTSTHWDESTGEMRSNLLIQQREVVCTATHM